MDKTSNQEFFAAILASNILGPFLEQNSELAELIKARIILIFTTLKTQLRQMN